MSTTTTATASAVGARITDLLEEASQLCEAIAELQRVERKAREHAVSLARDFAAHVDGLDEEWPSAAGRKGITGAREIAQELPAILDGERFSLPNGWNAAFDDIEEAVELLVFAQRRHEAEGGRAES